MLLGVGTRTNEMKWSDTRTAPREWQRAVLLEKMEEAVFSLETDEKAVVI
jgi:hypothetical protein